MGVLVWFCSFLFLAMLLWTEWPWPQGGSWTAGRHATANGRCSSEQLSYDHGGSPRTASHTRQKYTGILGEQSTNLTSGVLYWRTFLSGRWTRELRLSHSLSQCPRTVLMPHGSSSEAAVASKTLSKVLSFTVNPMINGISILEVQQTLRRGGPLKPVWTNTPTGCFSLWVTHLGLELEGYDRGSRWTAPAWLLSSSLC